MKGVGLPEIIEQSLFAEMFGNVLASGTGIATPEPAFVEVSGEFREVLRDVAKVQITSDCVGSRSLLPGVSPPTFSRMSPEQSVQAAEIYLFDLLVQNPDRLPGNANCLVVGQRLRPIDFEACFSFLYPIFGQKAHPWEVTRHGIATGHLFHGVARKAQVEWSMLVPRMVEDLMNASSEADLWMPTRWREWAERLRAHMITLHDHANELLFEVVRSLS